MRLRLFVSHSFHDEHRRMGLVQFRQCINDAISVAVGDGSTEQRAEVIPYFEATRTGSQLPGQVRTALAESDVILVDITGRSPNVFYELGYAHALGRNLILVQESGTDPAIPNDITDLLVGFYSDSAELLSHVNRQLSAILGSTSRGRKAGTLEPADRCFWFPETVDDVHIVCATEPEMSRFALPDAEDYLFLDGLEDRDALMEVAMFLSRARPSSRVLRHSSSSMAPDALESDLVVLGGPLNNHITRDLMRALGIELTYDVNEESAQLGAGEFSLGRGEAGLIVRDVGYFARFANPFNRRKQLVLCQGYHTFGTLAATKILADGSQASLNRAWLSSHTGCEELSELQSLQVLFPVEVLDNRRVVVPDISRAHVAYE